MELNTVVDYSQMEYSNWIPLDSARILESNGIQLE